MNPLVSKPARRRAPGYAEPPKPADPEPTQPPIDPEKGRVPTPEPWKPEHPNL